MSMLAIFIFLGTLGISALATLRVKRAFHKYSQVPVASCVSGAEAAARILDQAGIHDVEVVAMEGLLGDHYDPMHKRLVLSAENFGGRSAAAVGIAAHECGHAIQHQIAYAPLHLRMAAVTATTFASQIVMILPFLGYFGVGLAHFHIVLYVMVACWAVIMLFNLVTLPVEFDATRRAKIILGEMGLVQPGEEAHAVRSVLDAAGWTYVAAFLTSLAWLVYYLLPLLLGGRRSD